MKNILLVASQHGNETIGEQLYHYIQKHAPDISSRITFVIANPLAYSMGKRYVETDMNRSYVLTRPQTYEEYMAHGLLTHINRSHYDLVLDMHTTHCVQPPSLLMAPNSNGAVRAFIQASSIENNVLIDHEIVRTSLIGRARNAVSIELQQETVNDTALARITDDMHRYMSTQTINVVRHRYRIYDLIEKREITEGEAQNFRNFSLSSQGFYPILVGNNSYRKNTHYLGFKAEKL